MSPDFFKGNRRELKRRIENFADGMLVITAHARMQRSADTTYPFRQDSNFMYLTGLLEPETVLVMKGDQEFIILPKRSEVEDIFGGRIDSSEIAKTSGIQNILSYQDGWRRCKDLLIGCNNILTLMPAPQKISGVDAFFTNPARKELVKKLKRINKGTLFHDVRSELAAMRQCKQPEEIKAIKQAIKITKQGFEAAKKLTVPNVYEHEIEAVFDYTFKKHKAIHGYAPPIIAGGKNACALHYCNGTDQIKSGELVMLDVGAELGGYTADISRTYKTSEVSDRHKAVYNAVMRVHKQAIALLKDGLDWRAYITSVDSLMGEELIGLGLITTNTRPEVRKYFPHSISHSLGLDVHDVCDYKVIQKNMVITVEPGIYIAEEGIGIRVEDDILITANGAINLSSTIPYV